MLPMLNKDYITSHPHAGISSDTFALPERILQFGTGVLLRGLVDYLVDKANKQQIFNGRIVIIKSTDGDTKDFSGQDNLFTTHIKGVAQGELVNKVLINAAISRVLQSNAEWQEILKTAQQPTLQTIISNTTEVGIQYVEEDITSGVPTSYPGKLLAILWSRYQTFHGKSNTGFVIVPTELVVNNGDLLFEILLKLAAFNKLPDTFISWIKKDNHFCNSLVDRIVPGKPKDLDQLQKDAGYQDQLWIDVEPFLLWAIQGNEHIREIMSFHQADDRMLITPDITPYREQKLRILNGSHTISVPLAYLSGMNTVHECMEDPFMKKFFHTVVLQEILPTIREICPQADTFAQDVLDRFANPYIAHKLISITFQESSKMNARNVRTLIRYYEQHQLLPPMMCLGFAAMLLFLKPVKQENGQYFGQREAGEYLITDDNAAVFAAYWQQAATAQYSDAAIITLVQDICTNIQLWETNLATLPGFTDLVAAHLQGMIREGAINYAQHVSKATPQL